MNPSKVQGITKRWLKNSFSVIVVILAVIEVALLLSVKGYYYGAARQSVEARAGVTMALLENATQTGYGSTYSEMRYILERFDEKDQYEVVVLDEEGRPLLTSSGFLPSFKEPYPDYTQAIAAQSGRGEYVGKNEAGEQVMAITYTLGNNPDIGAVRFLTSLSLVDRQILLIGLAITGVSVLILLFVLFSSLYFIRSIVGPMGEIGATAKRIATGDFTVRIPVRSYDEIGQLADIINHMADELAKSDNVKNDFISSVSHELRTPLTAIKGWGETLMNNSGDPETVQKAMTVILSETDRLSSLVEELLDFSRMESGRLTLVMTKIDILAEIGEAVLMFEQRAQREGIALGYDEPQMVSPVFGDKNRLRQVFVNVLDNALKYTEPGGRVDVSVKEQGGFIDIVIADSGVGISQYDLSRVKTKFYKGNTLKKGSGIGLAVADEIVQKHGGELTLQSDLGRGTTVTVRLPVARPKVDDTTISFEKIDEGSLPH